MDYPGNPLRDALSSIALEAYEKELPCLVIGGNAAIHHGVPRFTRDIDLLIVETSALMNTYGGSNSVQTLIERLADQ